jgi:tryptophan synthase alpha chain
VGRIEQKLADLRKGKKKALVFFLTAGFPEQDSTEGIAAALEQGGADILEIGMPFSDPLADGPVIQHSSAVALNNGVTLDCIFKSVAAIRSRSSIPLVLMGYLNPIMEYGPEKFFSQARASGADGIILPELPLEEVHRFKNLVESNRLSQILLVTPTTPPDRIRQIDSASSGFLYCVSTTGVTGSGHRSNIRAYLDIVRRNATKNPLLVGFGISTPEDASGIAESADGVIVGSALLRLLGQKCSPADLAKWVRDFRESLP